MLECGLRPRRWQLFHRDSTLISESLPVHSAVLCDPVESIAIF